MDDFSAGGGQCEHVCTNVDETVSHLDQFAVITQTAYGTGKFTVLGGDFRDALACLQQEWIVEIAGVSYRM